MRWFRRLATWLPSSQAVRDWIMHEIPSRALDVVLGRFDAILGVVMALIVPAALFVSGVGVPTLVVSIVGVLLAGVLFALKREERRRRTEPQPEPTQPVAAEPVDEPKRVPAPPSHAEADEALVILCRRYALPAHEAAHELVTEVTAQCFERGGWRGIAARLLVDHVIPGARDAADTLTTSLDGDTSTLTNDLDALVAEYYRLVAYAYHFGSRDIPLGPRALERWDALDRAFDSQTSELAAGINRPRLATLAMRLHEPRQLLRSLREQST